MKVALFTATSYANASPSPCSEALESSKDYARVSEYVEVSFPPLADEVAIQQQLQALARTEQELREQFQRHLNGINDRRAQLQSLTHIAVAADDEEEAGIDYDDAPYCNAGHKTQASCDCGPYAANH